MAADSHVRVTDARRPRRWRFLLIAGALALAAVAAMVGWQALRGARARAELRQVIAELDRDEPDWRIEAIEAARAVVPDAENSAPVILQACKLTPGPRGYPQFERFEALLANLSPNVRLTDEQYGFCTNQLKLMERAIPLVEQVADMPRGRAPMDYRADGFSHDLVLINEARLVRLWPTQLLVLTRAHDGDPQGALRMCVVNLHIAAAIGDEPFLVCWQSRLWHVRTALYGLERLLGQGELPELDLAAFQAKLSAEAAHDPWGVGLRAERATHHQALEALARGVLSLSMYRMESLGAPWGSGWHDRARNWIGDRLPVPVEVYEADAWLLRRNTRLIRETANASWPERAVAMQVFADDIAAGPELARLSSSSAKFVVWLQGGVAQLRCGLAATAAERYRLRHGQWPESLAALVTEFLPTVPTDPFDNQPLRYRRTADGVVIYSVGPDGQDNGGTLSPAGVVVAAPGSDIGFTLWDVNRRRQPPPANTDR